MKDLNDFLNEDKDLTKKLSYEEFSSICINDNTEHRLEDAYATYCKFLGEN